MAHWKNAQSLLYDMSCGYFAVVVQEVSNPNSYPFDPVALLEKQSSFNPYKNTQARITSNSREINIFLTKQNWLAEVKGMAGTDIFAIAHDPLPELWKKVWEVVDLYISRVVGKLDASGPAEKLDIGDYNQ